MKKLILKSTVAALLAITSMFIVLFGVFSLTLPQYMENWARDLGLTRTEATYALQTYKKDNSIENLARAVQKNYIVQQYTITASYGQTLIAREDFDRYCQNDSSSTTGNQRFTTKVFFQSITAESCFYVAEYEKALQIAQNNYTQNGGNYQVVHWLLATPKIQENTDFYQKLQAIL